MSKIQHRDPTKQRIINKVIAAGQEHVFQWWERIGEEEKDRLLSQLERIDFDTLDDLYRKHTGGAAPAKHGKITPVEAISVPKNNDQIEAAARAARIGEQAIRAGEVAVFVVAGGQATRLGIDAPKGTLKITPVKEKSIFRHHAEKIIALSKRYNAVLPFYVMTSETNDEETRKFFENNNYFGLNPGDVFLFTQEMIPALDLGGKLILDGKDHIFENPNGHGGSISSLKSLGALADMQKRGIKHIFCFQIDNVLIKIADTVFLGYHIDHGAEMSAKAVPKRDPEEKVGVVCRVDSELTVIEYSDLPDELRYARNEDGSLTFSSGNIAIHVFDAGFVERISSERHSLPYHIAQKAIPFLDEGGTLVKSEEKNGLKFEKFVFDALGRAREAVVMEVVREEEFAPVKNATGEDSPATALELMQRLYAEWLKNAGVNVPSNPDGGSAGPIEISPLFALDAAELKEKLPLSFTVEFPLYLGPE
jgi:UDP-N-acetylglucosamine/UDP-N-acetylgalactosamine diphosphorylase